MNNLRLDKYLKISRIIKRRTIAKEVCANGRITINGRVAKPASEVVPGDQLIINFGQKIITAKVLSTPEVVKVQDAKELYEIIKEEHKNPGTM